MRCCADPSGQWSMSRVGAVVVTDGRHPSWGIFTGRNVAHRVLADRVRATLAEVMTSNFDTMLAGKIAIEALRLVEDGRYRYLPIVDDGKVVGSVSRFDFGGFELDRMDEEMGLWEGAHLTAEAWMRPTKNVSVRRRRGSERG